MAGPEMSPVPGSDQPGGNGYYVSADDIDLPELSRSLPGEQDQIGSVRSRSAGTIWAAALVTLLAAGSLFFLRGSSSEQAHANWDHVNTATAASTPNNSSIVRVNREGLAVTTSNVELTSRDADRNATQAVRAALQQDDLAAATRTMKKGQAMSRGVAIDGSLLELMKNAILAGEAEFFQIQLFDCCDEDGDVIDIEVNDQRFATVPLLHAGTTLLVPMRPGSTMITLRGVQDGGGGITVSFRTSQGEFYCRTMKVGEEYRMGVSVK